MDEHQTQRRLRDLRKYGMLAGRTAGMDALIAKSTIELLESFHVRLTALEKDRERSLEGYPGHG